MWALVIAGASFITAIVISMGKISRRGNDIAAGHREELLARENEDKKSGNSQGS